MSEPYEPMGRDRRIGLFGLGNMGAAVASRLARVGEVVAYDPDPPRRAAAARTGVRAVEDAADVARGLGEGPRVVVLSLPAPAVSRAVVAGLAPGLGAGGLIVETSTVNPGDVTALAEAAAPYGVRVVDAAILSGVAQLAAGTSALLVGGADADVEAAGPVLDALAARRTHFGPLGSGMAAKVINNAVAHAVMVVLVEAGAMARATGVPGRALVELLSGADAGLTRPLTHRFAERVLHGDYDGGMPTEAARKDSALALELARASGVPLFAIQAADTVYELGLADGLGRADYASVARLWEGWTGRAFPGPDA